MQKHIPVDRQSILLVWIYSTCRHLTIHSGMLSLLPPAAAVSIQIASEAGYGPARITLRLRMLAIADESRFEI